MTLYADACILPDTSQSSPKMAISRHPVKLMIEKFSGIYYNISLHYTIDGTKGYINVEMLLKHKIDESAQLVSNNT